MNVLKNRILKDSSVMIIGTVLAQIIPLFFQPVLKRIYTPEEFGAFDLYYKIFSLLTVIFALRYDIAPILPKSKKKSINLIILTFLLCIVSSVFSFIIIFIGKDMITKSTNIDFKYYNYMYILPFGVSFFVINSAFGNYMTKLRQFKEFSTSRIIRRSAEGITQLVFLGNGIGLYIGDLVGNLISTIYMIYKSNIIKYIDENKINKEELKNVALEYKRIPRYDLIPNLLNVFSMSILTFVIVGKFGMKENGYLELANKLLVLPSSIIAVSIGQIYLQRTTEIVEGKKNCIKEIKLITIIISIISLFFVIGVLLFSDEIIKIVFGEEWIKSAEICKILIWNTALSLVISPMGRILIGLGEFRINSIWQIGKFILIYVVSVLNYNSVNEYLQMYNITVSILYIIYLIIIIKKVSTFIKEK